MKRKNLGRRILFADLAWSVVAFFAAEALRYGAFWAATDWSPSYVLSPFLVAAIVFWSLLSSGMKLDCFVGGWRFPAVVSQMFLAIVCLMSILLSIGYLKRDYVSRLVLTYFGIFLFAGFLAIRYVAWQMLLTKYRSGRVRRVVIVGSGRIAREVGLKIHNHPEMLWQLVGFLCPEGEDGVIGQSPETSFTVPVVGVANLLKVKDVSDLILAHASPSMLELLKLAESCRARGIRISIVPQPYDLYLSKPNLFDLDGVPVLELHQEFCSDFFLYSKRFLDLVIGSLLSFIAIPILLFPVIRLRLMKGKAFRWETRCGCLGKAFSMLRLNVDRHAVDLTRFERMLVKSSLTELPQLWNVMRGEMSLVGPRPEPPDRVCRYSEWHKQRLSLKPGVTGLAQVQGLREQHSSEEKTHFDLQYLLHLSLWTDLSLLLQTVWTLAKRLATRKISTASVGQAVEDVSVGRHMQQEILEKVILENANRS
jgi:lipopolysaccharide/colanic/teichoic acid biosynthesis glycosyltransferase